MNKYIKYILFFLGVASLIIFLFWLNGKSLECLNGHESNKAANLCFYLSNSSIGCSPGHNFDGKVCTYKPEGIFSTKLVYIFLGIIFVSGVFYFLSKNYKNFGSNASASEFSKDDYVNVNIAEKFVIKRIVKKFGLYWKEQNGIFTYNKDEIYTTMNIEPFVKPNHEWFCLFEIKLLAGREAGKTVIAVPSLSRGIKYLENENYKLLDRNANGYTEETKKKPLYQMKDKAERHAEMLLQEGKTAEASKVMANSLGGVNSSASLEEAPMNRPMIASTPKKKTSRSKYGRNIYDAREEQ